MLEAVRLKGERWTHVRAYMKTDKTTRQLCERYKFYLDPSINWNDFTIYEDAILRKKVGELGRKWATIKMFFPDRTVYQLKNRYELLERTGKKNMGKMAEAIVDDFNIFDTFLV